MEQRAELADLLAATHPADSRPLEPLTQTMPLLVGTLTRAQLVWLCQSSEASALVRYIERDEQVSLI